MVSNEKLTKALGNPFNSSIKNPVSNFHSVLPIFTKYIYPYICLSNTKSPIEIMLRANKVSLFTLDIIFIGD